MIDDICTCGENCSPACDGSCGCEYCSAMFDLEDLDTGERITYYEDSWDY